LGLLLNLTGMTDRMEARILQDPGTASAWVRRWSHLIAPEQSVLDIACGSGRHMRWFAQRGHTVTGVDRSVEALDTAATFGQVILADLENGPWPLGNEKHLRQFGAVVVTNYLWRPLFPLIAASLAPGGLLIYETFSAGNETVGKPSRADFLLSPAELLHAFASLRIVAF
jgi:SAM-dependent methyltransferase